MLIAAIAAAIHICDMLYGDEWRGPGSDSSGRMIGQVKGWCKSNGQGECVYCNLLIKCTTCKAHFDVYNM